MPLAEASRSSPRDGLLDGDGPHARLTGQRPQGIGELQPSGHGGRNLGFLGIPANGKFAGGAVVVRLLRRPVPAPKCLGDHDGAVFRRGLLRRTYGGLSVGDLERNPPVSHMNGRSHTLSGSGPHQADGLAIWSCSFSHHPSFLAESTTCLSLAARILRLAISTYRDSTLSQGTNAPAVRIRCRWFRLRKMDRAQLRPRDIRPR